MVTKQSAILVTGGPRTECLNNGRKMQKIVEEQCVSYI